MWVTVLACDWQWRGGTSTWAEGSKGERKKKDVGYNANMRSAKARGARQHEGRSERRGGRESEGGFDF